MNKERKREVISDSLKSYKKVFIIFIIVSFINIAVFLLYGYMLEAALYAMVLGFVLIVLLWGIDLVRSFRNAQLRENAKKEILYGNTVFPPAENLAEKDYEEIIGLLESRIRNLYTEFDSERRDMTDYMTTWVHQIKTPIAVLHMQLADNEQNRTINLELFRIEQYVDMVLQYIRLGSGTNDLVIREYELDELIRRTIRKYASQFIARKLGMNFEETHIKITTDEKWFCCILEQLISNAIKYTPTGEVHIYLNETGNLCIADTGMGIAAEDLPRIFEKGYTGLNGRVDKRASGLGLYLAKRAADKLTIDMSAESTVGKGSTFILSIGR